MNLEAFKALAGKQQKDELKELGQRTSGTKEQKAVRYAEYLAANPQPAETTGAPGGGTLTESREGEGAGALATTSEPAPSQEKSRMLAHVLFSVTEHVSQSTVDCLDLLGVEHNYTTGKGKGQAKGSVSAKLEPVVTFVDTLTNAAHTVTLNSHGSDNFQTLKETLQRVLPTIAADPAINRFFEPYGITVIGLEDIGEAAETAAEANAREDETERETAMAMEASRVPARNEELARQRSGGAGEGPAVGAAAAASGVRGEGEEDDELEKTREGVPTGLERELLIIQNAMHKYLVAWQAGFPEPAAEDVFWPNDFSKAERIQLRHFVKNYLHDEHPELLRDNITEDEQNNAIKELREKEDFPIAKGQTASIVQDIFEKARAEHTNTQKRKAKKRKAAGPDDDNAEEEGGDEESRVSKKRKGKGERRAGDDEDDYDDEDESQRARKKRKGKGDSRAADVDDEDDDDDDDDKVVPPTRRSTRASARVQH